MYESSHRPLVMYLLRQAVLLLLYPKVAKAEQKLSKLQRAFRLLH